MLQKIELFAKKRYSKFGAECGLSRKYKLQPAPAKTILLTEK